MSDLLRIATLGHLTIIQNEKPVALPRKAEALLVYLACTGQAHDREILAELLWSDHTQERAMTSLRVVLTNLRRVVAPFLTVTRRTVAFNQDSPYWVDVLQLEEALALARRKRRQHMALSPEELTQLEQALTLYQGDFLSGFFIRRGQGFEEWLMFERERLQFSVIEARHNLAADYLAGGDYRAGIEQAQRALQLDPLREETHRQLMLLFVYNGQRSTALAQYQTCRQVLADELGIEPSPETVALYEQIGAGELSGSPEASEVRPSREISEREAQIASPPLRIPTPATPLIGRHNELGKIADALSDSTCRLLTLIGPGGIGKTRLAIEAAHQAAKLSGENGMFDGEAHFSQGIYLISLAPLNAVDLLATTIADTLGFTFYDGAEPIDQLLNYLREKRLLLVLDNFEHLLEGVELLATLLEQAPQVKILAVSRERLNIRGEWLLQVRGLEFPSDEKTIGHKSFPEDYSAGQLFLQHAQAIQPGFSLSTEEQICVLRICRLVEGIPLAVELAAAWVRLLSCQEIAAEIENNLDFLASSLRDMPERHRSLRAVFDYSWQLLSDEEKRAFKRLAVFHGGFQREAAERIAGASLPLLLALGDKSLLYRTETGRYERHLLLWQYAAEKLDKTPEEKIKIHDLHCDYYTAFLQHREPLLKGRGQQAALAEISAELENVRAQWEWAIDQEKIPAIDQAAGSLFFLYEMRSWFQEGKEAFGRAAAKLTKIQKRNPSATLQALVGKILARQGWFAFRLGQHEAAKRLLQDSLTLLAEVDPPAETSQETIFTRNYLGAIYAHVGDGEHAQAKQYLQENLGACREMGDQFGLSIALNILGWVAYLEGDYPQAQEFCQQSLDIKRSTGDRWGMAFSLDYLGRIAYALTELPQAQRLFHRSLMIHQELEDRYGIARSFSYLGDVALASGSYEEAKNLYQESHDICREIGNPWGVISALTDLGDVSCALEDYREGQAAYNEALKRVRNIQAPRLVLDVLTGLATFLTATEAAEQALDLLALILNHPASSRANQDKAARLLADVEPHLPLEVIRSVKERGQEQDLETVVVELLSSVEDWQN